jgi:hypothetical protein
MYLFCQDRSRTRTAATLRLALAAALLVGLLAPTLARAVIHPATVLVGPANDILDVDGAAMAPDGTGGIVYRKQVNGVAHVYAAQLIDGRWGAPTQVDENDPFGASQPAIAAGDGGRLLVVWVQARNVNAKGITLYELMGSSLEPGAAGFGQAIVIDPSVGEPYTGDVEAVQPKLAMAPDGVAYLVYRVVTNDCLRSLADPENSSCPLGDSTDKLVEVRVARYDYLLWSSLGAINRAPQIAMRSPTAANAPSIGIDSLAPNNGVVTWQEPGSDGVARIWVRRLFGVVQGNVLEASPETLGGQAVTSDADAPMVAVSPEGEARIAFRVLGAAGSAVTSTQLFLNSIPSSVDFHGSQLKGAAPIAGASGGGLGQPSTVVDQRGEFRLAWTQGGTAQELAGDDEATGSPLQIGAAEGQAFTTINPGGGGTTAWPVASPAGLPVVEVREDYAQGAFQLARLAGDVSGAVSGLSLGGDGQGNALLGWMQGPVGASEVMGDFVQAPPAPFQVTTPVGWVRAGGAQISWTAAPDAVPGVTYAVYVDGHPRAQGLLGLTTSLNPTALGDGVHRVQVLATDGAGQQTMSPASNLKIDVNPPIVKVKLIDHGRGIRVTVRDAASGVDVGWTRISFGDGRRIDGRSTVTHDYPRRGTYSITARVRDRVGNQATVHLRVRVR